MAHKDVDIIFVCYNNKNDIERCFRSLERYTESYHSLLVVDNHSEEETIQALSTYGQLLRKGGFVVKRNEKNLGYAKALNQGIRLTESRYLVFANLDIEFTAGWLPPILEQLEKQDIAFVGGKVYDGRGRIHSFGICGSERNRFHRGCGKRDRGQYDRVEEVVSLSGALFASKREIFKEIGMFDENFFLYFEETEMHIRARRAGYKIIYTPHSKIIHYLGKSPKKRDEAQRWFRESERYFNQKLGFDEEK
jgi:GT2 family glycosyltransferase